MKLLLIALLPFAGFVINGLVGRRLGRAFVSVVGCGLPLVSFALALLSFRELSAGGTPLVEVVYTTRSFTWLSA